MGKGDYIEEESPSIPEEQVVAVQETRAIH